ncbi:ATP-binding protein [Pseudenhygromyxa sp. WMMC2535]|uniref:ATP-binding protein n=1 Tax=Pseudenhygromyxa sp. WMMC2535 TaxID=2712867 RepID=UPI001553A56C|nr:ATP-binding protein [Pseudenhygromyxa sp. WMMC2535]NVB43051.1 ATP-binding protein [Pseudenhygromyxa sp. WMMC2535]
MSEDAVNVGQALDNLVHQFADPWSFLRELIQNAIDAGSREIDVRIEHEPPDEEGDGGPGLMLVEIVDSGEGMDREIIDTRLTRLFSSAKDGDYTKIGRFGIGFVSVFAIEPDLVCVDTGRAGEYWRVLFRADRSFERIALDMPVEGTTIRIYKQADEQAVEDARARARAVLDYWCKHAKVELRLDDELITRPMTLEAACVLTHEEEGTRLLLGLVEDIEPLRGYYHGGLTLHEEYDDRLPFVAFKIDSRYLEHTLTRDNVIRDENYDKAMAIIAKLAATRLPAALFAELAARTAAGDQGPQVDFLRARALDYVVGARAGEFSLDESVWRAAIFPRVGGPPCSIADLRARKRKLDIWLTPTAEPGPVGEALLAQGAPLLREVDNDQVLEALVRVGAEHSPRRLDELCTATPSTTHELARWRPLVAALRALLQSRDARISAIELGHLAYPGSPVAGHVAITQASFGALTPVAEIGKLEQGWLASKRVVVVNADHPTVAHLLELAGPGDAGEPELAAYLMLKLFYLRSALSPELDSALATAAAEARWQRSIN